MNYKDALKYLTENQIVQCRCCVKCGSHTLKRTVLFKDLIRDGDREVSKAYQIRVQCLDCSHENSVKFDPGKRGKRHGSI